MESWSDVDVIAELRRAIVTDEVGIELRQERALDKKRVVRGWGLL
jgi:hypothetical protein